MKILISPSKTQNKNIDDKLSKQENLLFLNESKFLNQELLNNLNNKDIKSWLEINNQNLFNETKKDIENYLSNSCYKAIEFYDGLQFKNIKYSELNENQKSLLNDNLIIVSAFYGLVFPNSYIKPYRLMMGSKIKLSSHKNLYDFWFDKLNQKLLEINEDKLIINLCSGEYSKVLDYSKLNIINVDFKLFKNNKYVSLSTFSKQCRGAFINEFVKVNFDLLKIKSLNILGFEFNQELSNDKNIIFTKNY